MPEENFQKAGEGGGRLLRFQWVCPSFFELTGQILHNFTGWGRNPSEVHLVQISMFFICVIISHVYLRANSCQQGDLEVESRVSTRQRRMYQRESNSTKINRKIKVKQVTWYNLTLDLRNREGSRAESHL